MGRLTRARRAQSLVVLTLTAALVGALLWGLDLEATHPALAALVTILFTLNAIALAGAAVTAVVGLTTIRHAPRRARTTEMPAPGAGTCAVLWLVCGEDPDLLTARIRAFLADLDATRQSGACRVFVLSDTTAPDARTRERAALATLGTGITYRNRSAPLGRKPGNLRDWLDMHGASFDMMLLLDADSGFSAARLARMRAEMAANPQLGIIQAAIRLRPGVSRFARLQRLSARLCGPVFAHGLARLSGDAGNFWGHNALIRTRAFAQDAALPELSGRAPWGGALLSHDFVEAAFLRRSGWQVQIAPDSRGSFEDAPETIATHLRRDRRWAQGNLQHLRVIAAQGLHPASRLHLAAGIQSYLSAPIWLALVLLFGSGAVHATAAALVPLAGMLGLLMVPKIAGVLARRANARTAKRRARLWRGFAHELALSTLFAPLAMLQRSGFVAAVIAGRDSGWQPSGAGRVQEAGAPRGVILAAGAIMAAVMIPQALIGESLTAAMIAGAMVLPVTLPLCVAPWLVAWFNRAPDRDAQDGIARYYDASTRRFLTVGGSGSALAIHRPLWDDGARNATEAAGHVNTLVVRAAEAALGQPPKLVRDLGCGVGGSLFHLAQAWPEARLGGLTLSAAQVRIGQAHLCARGLQGRVSLAQSDFTLPTTLPPADLVLAIESHVHSDSAASFLRAALLHLRPGGVLIIVDDMLAENHAPAGDQAARLIDAFRRGWHLGHVSSGAALVAEAERLGFEPLRIEDLTPMLRLDRLRDRVLRVAGPLADALGLGRTPFFANMIGGNALTQAYRHGLMRYRLVVLQLGTPAQLADPLPQPGKSAA
ncbi:MAG: glucans biosynthesis glucosyltransferase MdoH [Rhodobacteraceae bacterium]|nr:MAG: glucans biosynthesis glucosyltransferase MdoH [Paracoccaceae bacterium]